MTLLSCIVSLFLVLTHLGLYLHLFYFLFFFYLLVPFFYLLSFLNGYFKVSVNCPTFGLLQPCTHLSGKQ
jgi:hypothetical protein